MKNQQNYQNLQDYENLQKQNHNRFETDPLISEESDVVIRLDPENDLEQNNLDDINRVCRICFEIENQNEQSAGANEDMLFSPCRCDGTSKFVHQSCLNQWRATAANPEAFRRCFTCNYEYQTVIAEPKIGIIGRINIALAHGSCTLYMLNFLLIVMSGLAVKNLDSNLVIYNFFNKLFEHHNIHKNTMDKLNDNEYFYYYMFVSYIYLALMGLTLIINVIRMKPRYLYIKYIIGYHWIVGTVRMIMICSLTILTLSINVIIGCLILTFLVQAFIRMHYRYLIHCYRASQNKVLPYDASKDH